MTSQARIDELMTKHKALKNKIAEEINRPSADDMKIAGMKREKLRLKDEIAKLEAEIHAH